MPGANGIMGTEFVAKSVPDGYTLLVATAETHAINPSIYLKLRYCGTASWRRPTHRPPWSTA